MFAGSVNQAYLGAVHKLCAAGREGGLTKYYHTIFIYLIVGKNTRSGMGGGGAKMAHFWRYIVYGQPLV